VESGRQSRGDGLREDTDLTSPHPPISPDLLVDEPNDASRCGKADSFVSPRLAEDQSIDANDQSLSADEWTSAVARIDRRVGLEIDHPVFIAELTSDSTDHTHRHATGQSEGAAEGQHHLTGSQRVRIAQRGKGQSGQRYLKYGEVGFSVGADQRCGDFLRHWRKRGTAGHTLRHRPRKHHHESAAPLDHMSVSDDVAICAQEDSRASAPLSAE
jgi:hypothetical protein